MIKKIKLLFCLAVTATGLLILLLYLLPYYVNTTTFKDQLETWMEQKTGRDFEIQGQFLIHLFPWIGFEINAVRISNPPGFNSQDFIAVHKVKVHAQLWALLHRKIIVDSLILQQAQLNLTYNSDKLWNFRGLLKKKPVKKSLQKFVKHKNTPALSKKSAALLEFRHLKIMDSTLIITNEGLENGVFKFSNINFERKGIFKRSFTLTSNYLSENLPFRNFNGLKAKIELEGNSYLELKPARFAIKSSHLKIEAAFTNSKKEITAGTLEAQVAFNLLTGALDAKEIAVVMADNRLIGDVKSPGVYRKAEFKGSLQAFLPDINNTLTPFNLNIPDKQKELVKNIDIKCSYFYKPNFVQLKNIDLFCNQSRIAGEVLINGSRPPLYWGRLQIDKVNLRAWTPVSKVKKQTSSSLKSPQTLNVLLDHLNSKIDLELNVGQVLIPGLFINNLHLKTNLQKGEINIQEFSTGYSTGMVQGALQARSEGEAIRLLMDLGFKNLEINQPDFKTFVDGAVSLKTLGKTRTELVRYLSGSIDLNLRATKILGGKINWAGPPTLINCVFNPLKKTKSMQYSYLNSFSINGSGINIIGTANFLDLLQNPRAKGYLIMEDFNPRLVLKKWSEKNIKFEKQLPHSTALRTHFDISTKELIFKGLELNADHNYIQGDIKITNFSPPIIRFDLKGKKLDLDPYLAKKKIEPLNMRSQTKSRSKMRTKPALMAGTFINGTFAAEHLKIFKLNFKKPSLKLKVINASIHIDPFVTELYQGSAKGSCHLSLEPNGPAALGLELANVQIEPLWKDLKGKTIMSGSSNAVLKLYSRGADMDSISQHLEGGADIKISDGAFHGFHFIPDKARREALTAMGATNSKIERKQRFQSMALSLQIKNGLIDNNDLFIKGDYFKVAGLGQVSLTHKEIDYHIYARVTKLPIVPFHISGLFNKIDISFDKAEFVKQSVSGFLKGTLKISKDALGIGSGVLGAGADLIGDDNSVKQMGRGAFNIGKGLLGVGKGVLTMGTDQNEGADEVSESVRDVGNGIFDIGKGALDTGKTTIKSIGNAVKKFLNKDNE